MALTEEQIKEINNRRTAGNRKEAADKYSAVEQAQIARSWYEFLREHSGQRGVANGIYAINEANNLLMEEWIKENAGDAISLHSLEEAFFALQGRLARPSTAPYERKVNLAESHILPQQRATGMPPPDSVIPLPYTKSEILSWPKTRLKKELRIHGADALNRILNGN